MAPPTHGFVARARLLFAAVLLWAPAAPAAPARRFVADELLIGVRAEVGRSRAEGLYRGFGAAKVEEIPRLRVHRVHVPAAALAAVERALAKRPEFEFVERNEIFASEAVPNDPEYPLQWHLPALSLPAAWDVARGSGVVVAVLDTGVDTHHPDLMAQSVPGVDTYAGGTNTDDVYGHGTMVAGVAAARGDNGIGVASPALDAWLMPIRVAGAEGSATASSLANGLSWAVDHGARVMNVSFGGVAGSGTVRAAAQYVFGRGGVVVAASGNCGCREAITETPYILSVGATDASDQIASFSSRGEYVDVAAPGVSIHTTLRGGGYGGGSGTSFSSPVVAGIVAQLFSVNQGLTPAQAVAILEDTAVDLGTPGYDEAFGHGRVDANAAVRAAAAGGAPAPDTTPPTASLTAPQAGASVSGSVRVAVAASDDVAVARVEILLDGSLLATDAWAPFEVTWDAAAAAAGPHVLEAVAYDAAGNEGSSGPVAVAVVPAIVDAAVPTVAVRSPKDGDTVSKQISIAVDASDDTRVQAVEVWVDGTRIGSVSCSAATCSASVGWNARKAAAGPHSIVGRAVDASGNVGTSSPVTVTKFGATSRSSKPAASP